MLGLFKSFYTENIYPFKGDWDLYDSREEVLNASWMSKFVNSTKIYYFPANKIKPQVNMYVPLQTHDLFFSLNEHIFTISGTFWISFTICFYLFPHRTHRETQLPHRAKLLWTLIHHFSIYQRFLFFWLKVINLSYQLTSFSLSSLAFTIDFFSLRALLRNRHSFSLSIRLPTCAMLEK